MNEEMIFMAEPIRNAQELQKQLAEFQDLQRQLQVVIAQRQQLSLQLEEIKSAQIELDKAEKGIYRYMGPLLIETTKTEAGTDLKEKRDLFEMRVGVLEKQESRLRPKFDELRSTLEKALNPGAQGTQRPKASS
jgi:prefoldin beta subunit